MTRKTIDVATVLDLANNYLRQSEDRYDVLGWTERDMVNRREGVATLLEAILMHTENYRGFTYLNGVIDYDNTPPKPGTTNVVGDESRRRYH